jgi:hypothetical protein
MGMLMGAGAVALFTLLEALAPRGLGAQGSGSLPSQSAARVTGQVAVGTLLTPVAFLGAGWAADRLAGKAGLSEDAASRAGYISAYSATWLAAASGPALVGNDGKFGAALGGSAAGLGAAYLATRLGNLVWDDDRRDCGVGCWSWGVITIALPSVGATIAYNLSRK